MTTHLMKLGPSLPYQAQTECGMTVDTLALVDHNPTCYICSGIDFERELEAAEALAELEMTECRRQSAN